MPRQLPWASKGAGSRTQVKPSTARQAKKSRAALDLDDDFFDDTVLGSSKDKGKGRAEDSDDDLPSLPAELSTPKTKTRTNYALQNDRAQSSSPPPIDDLEQPRVEGMHKGVTKFDLRDDEYMMVEDEFLETAKLFTRHLHIAEYERMKEMIEEKKKEAEVPRPVVLNAKMSVEGAMKENVRIQGKTQKKAIRDVFASQKDNEEEEDPFSTHMASSRTASSFQKPATAATESSKPSNVWSTESSDSDDLDAPRPLPKPAQRATVRTTPTPVRTSVAGVQRSGPTHTCSTKNSSSNFTKPSLPGPKPRSRISRATPFDMLEDIAPIKSTSNSTPAPALDDRDRRASHPAKSSPRASSPAKRPSISRARRSIDMFDNTPSSHSNETSKETTARLEKRKAEREKDDKEKKRRTGLSLDDVPTFLF